MTENSILQKVQNVTDLISKKEKDDNDINGMMQNYTDSLHEISLFLDCSNVESLLFCAIFYKTITEGYASNREIAEFIKCGPYDLLKLKPDITSLIKKKIILKKETRRFGKEEAYFVSEDLINAITKSIKPKPEKAPKDLYELADKLMKLFQLKGMSELNGENLLTELERFELVCPDFAVYALMKELNLSQHEKAVLIRIVVEVIQGSATCDLYETIENLFDQVHIAFEVKRLFSFKKTKLITENYLEFDENFYKSERRVKLTAKSLNRIFGSDVSLMQIQGKSTGHFIRISHKDISAKELFYNEEERKSVYFISECIKKERYKELIDGLKKKNMPAGITALFHGYPGTGKTETVYQLGSKSTRDVIKVDISSIRDKYVGESEKRLKNVFDDYKKLCEKNEHIPILLFNESDSLFSKRMNVGHSVDQMNNVMQNILLEELENFNGILFATTNLTINLDKAFERRFLFKIKFKKPSVEAKAKIWQSKIEGLTDDNALFLARDFNLSGGEIENIARKTIIDSLLGERVVGIEKIAEYCRSEKIEKVKSNPIGFVRTVETHN